MTTLWDSIKKGLRDSAKLAKDGAHVAAEKAEELGKKSKVMIEISNIKRRIEKNFTELGGKAYHLIQEEKVKDVASEDEIIELLKTINSLEDDMKIKHEELEQISVAYHTAVDKTTGDSSASGEKSE